MLETKSLNTLQGQSPDKLRDWAGAAVLTLVCLCFFIDFVDFQIKHMEVLMHSTNNLLEFFKVVAPAVAATQHIAYYGSLLWQHIVRAFAL